jgi:hypothetical protein
LKFPLFSAKTRLSLRLSGEAGRHFVVPGFETTHR